MKTQITPKIIFLILCISLFLQSCKIADLLPSKSPKLAPRISESPFFIYNESNIEIDFDENYTYVEIESGDENFGKKKFGNGQETMEHIKYSYFYPHKGPFPLKITVTNNNGSTTFDYSVKGNEYSNFQKSFSMNFTKEWGWGNIDIEPLPNFQNVFRIDGVETGTNNVFNIKPFASGDNKLNNVKVEFPELFGGQLDVDYNSTSVYVNRGLAIGAYNLQTNKQITITPIGHRFLYIKDFSSTTPKFICTEKLIISTKLIRLISYSTLNEINAFYKNEPNYTPASDYKFFFDYSYTKYMPSKYEKNGWYFYTEFPYLEQTKGKL